MGTVFLAKGPDGRRVAVKMIRRELAKEPEYRRRFEKEVAAAKRVRSFSTARVLDARLGGPPLYLVTEYIEGQNLREFVRTRGPLAGSDLEQLAVGTAAALAAIHNAALVHRDLKPANVLLSQGGVRVIDFGVARPLDVVSGLTEPGIRVGTPQYMAPEVFRAEPVTKKYDIFAWGGVVVFAATGRAPFDGRTATEVLHRIAHDPPRLDGLPKELGEVVAAALAKQPSDRPKAWELLELLVGPDEDVERSARPGRREPAPPAFVLCGGQQDAPYARRLVTYLRERDLPVRSVYEEPDVIDRLAGAPALIALLSPSGSNVVREGVDKAKSHGLEVFRILLDGRETGGPGYYDARGGLLPGEAEIRWLQRMAAATAEPSAAPGAGSGVPGEAGAVVASEAGSEAEAESEAGPAAGEGGSVAAATDDRFARLRRFLGAGRLVAADVETTELLLRAAGQSADGWLKEAERLDPGFLRDLGTVWTAGTGGRHGFAAQLDLRWGHSQEGSTRDFRALTKGFGWAEKLSGKPNTYHDWVTRNSYPPGFFPTLRNPANETQNGWYDRWRITVMTVHAELRRRL